MVWCELLICFTFVRLCQITHERYIHQIIRTSVNISVTSNGLEQRVQFFTFAMFALIMFETQIC